MQTAQQGIPLSGGLVRVRIRMRMRVRVLVLVLVLVRVLALVLALVLVLVLVQDWQVQVPVLVHALERVLMLMLALPLELPPPPGLGPALGPALWCQAPAVTAPQWLLLPLHHPPWVRPRWGDGSAPAPLTQTLEGAGRHQRRGPPLWYQATAQGPGLGSHQQYRQPSGPPAATRRPHQQQEASQTPTDTAPLVLRP